MRLDLLPRIALRLLPLAVALGTSTAALAAPYVPPPGIGAPGRRESAGTRGCTFGNPAALVGLMPEANIGYTTEAYPSFYWYLPVNQASFVQFTLSQTVSEGDAPETAVELYQTRFAVSGEAGIVGLQLPDMAGLPPLAEGDRYQWQVAIFCNPNSENGDLQVQGWVERRSPDVDLAETLAAVHGPEQAALYATNGYWFDAVAALATLQIADPEDDALYASWVELLESVGLDALTTQPFMVESSQP